MIESAQETYKGCRIMGCAKIDCRAAEGLQLNSVYIPFAQVLWRTGDTEHEKRLCDPKGHVFANPEDAVKLALALAKRFIDEMNRS